MSIRDITRELDHLLSDVLKFTDEINTGEIQRILKEHTPKRSGRLSNNWRIAINKNGINIWNDLPYARIQDFGGVIHGKPWLKIPLRGETGTTVNGFWIKSKNGNPLLVEKHGKSITPVLVLVRSVRIKGQYYTRPAIEKIESYIERVVHEHKI